MKREISVFLDNEGPCTRNDNAQESIVKWAIKSRLGRTVGEKFFNNMSKIDDLWGDFHLIPKDKTYSSGHSLKVVLPFLKAMGATETELYKFAGRSLRVVPCIGEAINNLTRNYHYRVWQISTSYNFFIKAFCDQVGFDFSRARCTEVKDFNLIPISPAEAAKLKKFMRKVAQMPELEYDLQTGELAAGHAQYYQAITEFIWEEVYNMPVGEFLRQVHPIGQEQKCLEMESICKEHYIDLGNVMYVGDSQTDRGCVKYLSEFGGLSMMFNGKGQVCYESDLMYIGKDARVIELVAGIFAVMGRKGTLHFFREPESINGGILVAVNGKSKEEVAEWEKASVAMRKEFRGKAIGELT